MDDWVQSPRGCGAQSSRVDPCILTLVSSAAVNTEQLPVAACPLLHLYGALSLVWPALCWHSGLQLEADTVQDFSEMLCLILPEVNIEFVARCHCWITVTSSYSQTLICIFFKTCLSRLLIIEILKNFGLTVKKVNFQLSQLQRKA